MSDRLCAAMCADQMLVEYFKQWPGASGCVYSTHHLAQWGIIFMDNISVRVWVAVSVSMYG